jgi:hypothetical protein
MEFAGMQVHTRTPQSRFNDLIPAIGSLGLLATGIVFFYAVNPVTSRLIPPCPFLWATNCYCPGCGAARAFHSLARGDLGAAMSYNPLLVLALPALGYVYISFLGGAFFDRRLPSTNRFRAWTWVVPFVLILYTVARNLPWEPFTLLAP